MTASRNASGLNAAHVAETFVDGLQGVTFDGLCARLQFAVNRFESPTSGAEPIGIKVTVARVVIPLPGLVELASQLNGLINSLEKKGALNEVTLVRSSDDLQ